MACQVFRQDPPLTRLGLGRWKIAGWVEGVATIAGEESGVGNCGMLVDGS
jgi:hypothetical protein